MATEFVMAIRIASSTGPVDDYNTVTAWEAACPPDLTAATVKVFGHGGVTGTISDGASVTGVTSSATATVSHCTVADGSSQICLESISGTFQSGEKVEVDASNHVTLSDAGDSVIWVGELYDDWTGDGLNDGFILAGTTTSATNYQWLRAATGAGVDGVPDTNARMYLGNVAPKVWDIQDDNFKLGGEGLGIQAKHNWNSGIVMQYANAGMLCDSLQFVSNNPNKTNQAVFANAFVSVEFRNCIAMKGFDGQTFQVYDAATWNNCGALDSTGTGAVGFQGRSDASTGTAKNCVSYGHTTDWALNFKAASTNNASDSTNSPGSSPQDNIDSADFTAVDNTDWSPANGQQLDSNGTDLSGTFNYDITGTSRAGDFDIGPLIAAAGGSVVGRGLSHIEQGAPVNTQGLHTISSGVAT